MSNSTELNNKPHESMTDASNTTTLADAAVKLEVRPTKAEQAAPAREERTMILSIMNQTGDTEDFRIKRNTRMGKPMTIWCKLKNLEKQYLRFLLDGKPVMDDHTAESVRLAETI